MLEGRHRSAQAMPNSLCVLALGGMNRHGENITLRKITLGLGKVYLTNIHHRTDSVDLYPRIVA